MRRLAALLILSLLFVAPRPAPASGEEAPTESTEAVDEMDVALDLVPSGDLPEPARREIGELNRRFLILNMHGALFHRDLDDFYEDVAYAAWMNAGVIRVFATDAGEFVEWDGERLGHRIADVAPSLRRAGVKLIVALVNNHKAVPGERPESFGWMDNYYQLLLPFYQEHWRGAYLTYIRQLISTVVDRGARDVIWAWELGNELHTPRLPRAVMPFINAASVEVRTLDPGARVLAGTMGANHLEPGVEDSEVARALYCYGPISAYTLHTYDWINSDLWGDMPIHWDFEQVVNQPCPNGRAVPVLVEELGTSRAVPGLYGADREDLRLAQEINQLRMVLGYAEQGVIGIGVWSAESPLVRDISRFDKRRGLTSYGPDNLGSGSCYRPPAGARPGVRCELERILQKLPTLP